MIVTQKHYNKNEYKKYTISHISDTIYMTEIIQRTYTLSQFNNIIFDGITYELPTNIIHILQTLNGLLVDNNQNAPTDINEDRTNKKPNPSYSRGKYLNTMGAKRDDKPAHFSKANMPTKNDGTDWAILRNYKTTKIEEKQGTEKTLNEIRITLNKISNKNYEQPRDVILQLIKEIFETETNEDETSSDDEIENKTNGKQTTAMYITRAIFDIASTNKFYSEIYATLYKDLSDKYTIFSDMLNVFVQKYIDTFATIQYVDANDNYDQFCEYTKNYDQQKATTVFIVNLLKSEIISQTAVFGIIQQLYLFSLTVMKQENRENEMEEIAECMNILITQSKIYLKTHETWNETVAPMCSALSCMKTSDYKSITNRVIFKFKDIVGNI